MEHGLVHRNPQQQAGEAVGGQARLVDPQQSVLGETLERACQGGQDPPESPAAKQAGDRKAVSVEAFPAVGGRR